MLSRGDGSVSGNSSVASASVVVLSADITSSESPHTCVCTSLLLGVQQRQLMADASSPTGCWACGHAVAPRRVEDALQWMDIGSAYIIYCAHRTMFTNLVTVPCIQQQWQRYYASQVFHPTTLTSSLSRGNLQKLASRDFLLASWSDPRLPFNLDITRSRVSSTPPTSSKWSTHILRQGISLGPSLFFWSRLTTCWVGEFMKQLKRKSAP